MIMEVISILLGVILLSATGYGYGYGGIELYRFSYLVDIPSLVIVLVFTVPVLFKSGVWKDFKRAWRLLRKNYICHLSELRRTLDVVEMMQKQVIYAGVICMLLSLITMLGNLSDLASVGPNMAVAILTMLYALVLEMLLLPLQLEVKRRIIDYMEVDTDTESERAAAEKENEVAMTGKKSGKADGEAAAGTEDRRS